MKRPKIDRPRIIVHMVISLDERVTGSFLDSEVGAIACEEYYRLHREYKAQGFICGRVTMEGSFTKGQAPELDEFKGANVEREDYVAKKAPFYAVSIDPRGVLGWQGADICDEDEGYNGAHIIEVLSDKVSDEYVAFLRSRGISYIFCGEDKIDIPMLCEKLKSLFGIEKILLEGGPVTNTAFLEAGVIDKVNVVVAPTYNNENEGDVLFHGLKTEKALRSFRLAGMLELKEKCVLMTYESKK